jgi:hypothetical protein
MTHAPCDCPRCQYEAENSPLGYGVFTPDDSQDEVIACHVVPGNDISTHTLDDEGSCGCHPYVDAEADTLLYHHFAFDGREAIIHGTRKPS